MKANKLLLGIFILSAVSICGQLTDQHDKEFEELKTLNQNFLELLQLKQYL